MRSTILLITMLGPMYVGFPRTIRNPEPPRVAATAPNPDYPLKVRVLSSDRREDKYGTHSYGSGNLLNEPAVGFDYTSECAGGFLHNAEKGEFYQGKWKKPQQQFTILTQQPGQDRVEKCDVKVTLKSAPYSKDNPPPRMPTANKN